MDILTLSLVLAGTAFLTTIVSAMGRCPLWVPVMLLCVLALVKALPPR